MPWARYHGVQAHYFMAELIERVAEESGGERLNMNLTQTLVQQIQAYARGTRRDLFEDMSRKDPRHLSDEDRSFIFRNLLMRNRLADESLRYVEIRSKIENGQALSDKEIFDLQVLSPFIWFPPLIRDSDAALYKLYKKGRCFNLSDKHEVFSRMNHYMEQIIPRWRRLQEHGLVELSTSPYSHAIVPILCDSNVIKESAPYSPLPDQRYCYPEDAEDQINAAVEGHQQTFGRKPEGMWPSEGAICNDMVPPLEKAGIRWIASGQQNLLNSLNRTRRTRPSDWPLAGYELYSPWMIRYQGSSVCGVFRDRGMSDDISFRYKNWDANDAVNDFMNNCRNIAAGLERNPGNLGGRPGLIFIALDGDNFQEYYPRNGQLFIEMLFSRLAKGEDGIVMTTVSEYLTAYGCPDGNELTDLWPGSWIDGSLATWTKSQASKKAWEYLAKARSMLAHCPPRRRKVAMEYLRRAQCSCWFWWYGGDYFSLQALEYDRLFRGNLIQFYRTLKLNPPDYLFVPLIGNN